VSLAIGSLKASLAIGRPARRASGTQSRLRAVGGPVARGAPLRGGPGRLSALHRGTPFSPSRKPKRLRFGAARSAAAPCFVSVVAIDDAFRSSKVQRVYTTCKNKSRTKIQALRKSCARDIGATKKPPGRVRGRRRPLGAMSGRRPLAQRTVAD